MDRATYQRYGETMGDISWSCLFLRDNMIKRYHEWPLNKYTIYPYSCHRDTVTQWLKMYTATY